MITVNQAVKRFDGYLALDHIDLTVPTGAIYGLVGPNGAGKTTLLRHLNGVLRPDSGQVSIDGAPVYECAELKQRIASIPDDIYYHPQATIQDMMRSIAACIPGLIRSYTGSWETPSAWTPSSPCAGCPKVC